MSATTDQNELPVALSVAGSDSGGGAGIQADLLTFAANRCYGTTAITCLTAQNPDEVSAIQAMPASFVKEQIQRVFTYFRVSAVKTGMLFNTSIIEAVSACLSGHKNVHLVVDPVMVSTSGAILLETSAIDAFRKKLLPLADVFTPNLDEAAVLLDSKESIANLEAMELAARELARQFGAPCLLKGGHLVDGGELFDIFATPEGEIHAFSSPRIEKINTHGSGCTLSSAIAANLAGGQSLLDAIENALGYVRNGMRHPVRLNGIPFIQH